MATSDSAYGTKKLKSVNDAIMAELHQRIVGQQVPIEQILTAFFAGGHCLIVGMPGVAKTLLVNCLAHVMDLQFKRIQFTPDLMPSDITGTEILEEDKSTGTRELKFVQGPVFANVVLADEINRTPPKTQAALLESMQEKQVTLGGKTRPLPKPFFVFATQLPMEQEGTYPLPEAQQDRFMFNISMGYLNKDEETTAVKASTAGKEASLRKVLSGEQLLEFQKTVRDVAVPRPVVNYIVDIVAATRPAKGALDFVNEYVGWGAGPRASQYITLGAKSRAALSGRDAATIEDARAVAAPVLRHRIGLNFRAEVDKVSTEDVINRILEAKGKSAAA